MADHAKIFSASSFERLMLCPGSAVLCADAPRRASQYSAEGTCIHEASARVLLGEQWPAFGDQVSADGYTFVWDADMQDCGQAYVDYVQGLDADFLFVEQRVRFGPAIGVGDPDDGFGTADAVAGKGGELIVIDLKCGRGVDVQAGDPDNGVPNPQLALYAIGALADLQGLAGDFDTVRLVIVQPRCGGVSEYVLTVDELNAWARAQAFSAVSRVAEAQQPGDGLRVYLNPTEKGCKFCAAKATCPALRDAVVELAFVGGEVPLTDPSEFAALEPATPADDTVPEWISAALSKVDMIEDWCKAVRAEAERRLTSGEPVPGYKLVAGRKGARAWSDEAQAEEVLRKQMRLAIEDAYTLKLITPPQAEKLHKAGKIGPRQWPRLQQLITQGEGKPSVAPESDPRPPITVAAVVADFDIV